MVNKSFSCFADPGAWCKGNLHSHTTNSDGDCSPEEVVDWYCKNGYDFLCITDHNVITDVSKLQRDDFLVLPGIEFGYRTDEDPDYVLDMLGINMTTLPDFLDPEHCGKVGNCKDISPQRIIDEVNRQGGIAVMCHPYYYANLISPYLRYHSYAGLEVYNFVCDELCGRAQSEIYLDALLLRGAKLFAFASDDSHEPDFGHAWIEVKAAEKTIPAILTAIREGSFYATTGIKIFNVTYHDSIAEIEFDRPCDAVFMNSRSQGMVKARANTYKYVDGRMHYFASYKLRGTESYLRIELRDKVGNRAYTNPIFLKDI